MAVLHNADQIGAEPPTVLEPDEVAAATPSPLIDWQALLEAPRHNWPRRLADHWHCSELSAIELAASALGMVPLHIVSRQGLQCDFDILSLAECQRRRCVVSYRSSSTLQECACLVFDALDSVELDQWLCTRMERLSPKQVLRVLASPDELDALLEAAGEDVRALKNLPLDEGAEEAAAAPESLVLSIAGIEDTANPVVRLVDSTLFDALRLGASDIHFELQHRVLHIKYRLDGVLQAITQVDGLQTAQQVISRIKVLSDLDISERRVPQDGRFRVSLDRREIDFRVSVMPNSDGEDAVLRILDRKHLTGVFSALSLDSLNFAPLVKAFVRRASHLPHGLLLVTGPTGSGKTTTLYAAISEINTGLDKIVTIEDPIEYQLQGVLQIPVNERKGLTFARGLRSILRHDPDKIMVGEIRDSETAQIAVQAALTGHQVFTTVHANNVFDVIGRFANMGVDRHSLVAALTGIVAQRLVRKVCTSCAQGRPATTEELATWNGCTDGTEALKVVVKRAVGCAHCRGTGYKGRIAVAETLPIDDEIKDLLLQDTSVSALRQRAKAKGTLSLRDSAIALVTQGVTTPEEIERVVPAQ